MNTEEYAKKIQGLFGDRYIILGEYVDGKTKILVRCNICSHEWEIRPDALYKGSCPKCSALKKSIAKSEFLNRLFGTHGEKYVLVGEYEKYSKKVRIKCNLCGNEWYVLPNNLIEKKSGCPECSKEIVAAARRSSHEDFFNLINEKMPNRYTLLTEYTDAKSKLLVRCNIDGYEWETLPGNLLKGVCPKCGNRVKRTNEMFINEIKQKYGNEYSPLSEFVAARKKVKMRHNLCGYEWEVTPDKFLTQNRKCPKCFGKNIKEQEDFLKEVKQKHGELYTVIGEYINSKTHLLVKCNTCNNEWMITPDNLLRGYGCPVCSFSKGELKIKGYLSEKKIDFKTQHIFEDLWGNYQPLRFDFAIFSDNQLKCLIEFDGLQHYEMAGYVTQEKFDLQKEYDNKKEQYCINNNLSLYRIPYWEIDNIPEIIDHIVKEHLNL